MLEFIINKENNTENILLLENGKIIEQYKRDNNYRSIEGNIYVGKVVDVINGMQAAFIDFGEEKNGFIHLKDIIPQKEQIKEQIPQNISEVLRKNQKILVQVKKEGDDKKGARVSTHIGLPGKNIVLMPNTDFVTISQKVTESSKKDELIKYVKENIPKDFGAIIRTSAELAEKDKIKDEIEQLLKIWNDIEKKYKNSKNEGAIIWKAEDLVEKMITDMYRKNIDKITVNDIDIYNKIQGKLKLDNIEMKLVLEKGTLLNKYDINQQLEKIENRKIWLNCGGFITIDKTEALTAIDVNTGKFTGKKDVESTIFKVNKEAAIEISKQLRLRDIGGIIIIDFIDMNSEEHKQEIEEILRKEFLKDRAKTQIEGFSKLNLMEVTRKKISGSNMKITLHNK